MDTIQPSTEIILTEDGSHSLLRRDLGEHYHSTFGAIQESEHIFIAAGLKEALQRYSELNILEIGFGTGLNAWLTLLHTCEKHRVQYHGVEALPLGEDITFKLNYAKNNAQQQNLFKSLHTSPWEELVPITSHFLLKKIHTRAELTTFPTDYFHLVYFDAFAPQYEPCLWTVNVFNTLFQSLKQGGILVTYCCKGEVKRNLNQVGFSVSKLPGPKGKREFIRAEKKTQTPDKTDKAANEKEKFQ